MNQVFQKLQLKDHDPILVLSAPAEFRAALDEIGEEVRVVQRATGKSRFGFLLAFVRGCSEIEAQAASLVQRLEDDGVLWFAYPKKSSKRYTSDIGRDDSWQVLGTLGFEAVRMVAIDEDWSALRFRHVDHIKSLNRDASRALMSTGKQRAQTRKKA